MQKKLLVASVFSFIVLICAVSCKKSSPKPTANGNVQHALSDSFYVSGLLDTTWTYSGTGLKDECQANGIVCSSFIVYGIHGSYGNTTFYLSDSAHPNPQDTTIMSWVGKTFVTSSDTAAHHAYTFSFSYPDSISRTMSTDYIINNTGAQLTVTSVSYEGLSVTTHDTTTYYPMYKLQGTLTCKLTHLGDTAVHKFTQGKYSINVMEAQ